MQQDITEAVRLYKQAGDRARPRREFGPIAPPDCSKLPSNGIANVKFFRCGVHDGDEGPQAAVGGRCVHGHLAPLPDGEDLKICKNAADLGIASAQVNLADRYAKGVGVPQSDTEAIRLYKLAAAHGNVDAQVALGLMAADGRYSPQ